MNSWSCIAGKVAGSSASCKRVCEIIVVVEFRSVVEHGAVVVYEIKRRQSLFACDFTSIQSAWCLVVTLTLIPTHPFSDERECVQQRVIRSECLLHFSK